MRTEDALFCPVTVSCRGVRSPNRPFRKSPGKLSVSFRHPQRGKFTDLLQASPNDGLFKTHFMFYQASGGEEWTRGDGSLSGGRAHIPSKKMAGESVDIGCIRDAHDCWWRWRDVVTWPEKRVTDDPTLIYYMCYSSVNSLLISAEMSTR